MVEIDQDYERDAMASCGDNFRHSFVGFMQWHNPMELNSRQVCLSSVLHELFEVVLRLM